MCPFIFGEDLNIVIWRGSNLGDFNFIHLLDSGLDLWLVGLDIDDEDKGVVVFDLLHGGFSGQWVLDG